MKKTRRCCMFVFDGFADWETSHAIAGLSRFTDFRVDLFSSTGRPVRSMGNTKVTPDLALSDIQADHIDLLLLPGGGAWEEGANREVIPLVRDTIRAGKVVAAISGATILLGQEGHLNCVGHTSDNIEYLSRLAPAYCGEDWYINKPCVRDSNLITANGAAGLEFAAEIFRHFGLEKGNESLNSWFRFFQPAVRKHPDLFNVMTRLR